MIRKQNQQGFTLLEILLVLVVMALVSIVAISSIPFGSSDADDRDAHSLYQRISLLQEDAILSGRSYGVTVTDNPPSVVFTQWLKGTWAPVPNEMMNSELQLASDEQIIVSAGGDVWLDKERLYQPNSDDDALSDKPKSEPQIMIYPNGMMTSFTLTINKKNGSVMSISATDGGDLVLKEGQ
ncbi:GspH/FimT family protein [Vibrio sp.]|uniref:GspH/FimT family protein n=1 Tax=Vibrio viridaestus TaxID=2487322 RepID=UPI00140AB228|nr:GspH/FimT family protein [Vibrio viridaestus]MDC0610010.1 GspH/FimT family protein [Vibrio sp.]